jgi:hypothetical protein
VSQARVCVTDLRVLGAERSQVEAVGLLFAEIPPWTAMAVVVRPKGLPKRP